MPSLPLDAAKKLGEAFKVLVENKEYLFLDDLARASDPGSAYIALYNLLRTLATYVGKGDKSGKQIFIPNLYELQNVADEVIRRMLEHNNPKDVRALASLIASYALAGGLPGLVKSAQKKQGGE